MSPYPNIVRVPVVTGTDKRLQHRPRTHQTEKSGQALGPRESSQGKAHPRAQCSVLPNSLGRGGSGRRRLREKPLSALLSGDASQSMPVVQHTGSEITNISGKTSRARHRSWVCLPPVGRPMACRVPRGHLFLHCVGGGWAWSLSGGVVPTVL